MLMLVVTIIIAAIVSAFAGGMSGSTSKTPQATLSATVTVPPAGNQTVFSHEGGDAFDLKDIRVMFQSQDTKTTLTTSDVGIHCIAFRKVGSTAGNTMIKPGDSFVIVGSKDPYEDNTVDYGSFAMSADTKVTWSIIDKASGGTIASGTMVL